MVKGLDKDSIREPIFDTFIHLLYWLLWYNETVQAGLGHRAQCFFFFFVLCEMHRGGFILCEWQGTIGQYPLYTWSKITGKWRILSTKLTFLCSWFVIVDFYCGSSWLMIACTVCLMCVGDLVTESSIIEKTVYCTCYFSVQANFMNV